MTKAGDKYTILVLSDTPGEPKRVEVSRKMLRRVVAVAGVAALGMGIGMVDYVRARMDLAVAQKRHIQLTRQIGIEQDKADQQRLQLASLRDEVLQLRRAVSSTAGLERDIRQEQGLPAGSVSPVIASAVGGVNIPLSDDFDAGDIESMHGAIRQLITKTGARQSEMADLRRYFRTQKAKLAERPNRWPIKGWVTSGFGVRQSPFTGEQTMHQGVDIAAPTGTVVTAPAGGTVVFVGLKEGFGNYMILDHGGGFTTHFGHLASSLVAEGRRVTPGMPIALVGNTGQSTGPHLHYEVHMLDVPTDPMAYLPDDPEAYPTLAQAP
ncbi:M23 family metallopeptidase [bacterium]|nr:M23 family metallopeptidase [bacterium]